MDDQEGSGGSVRGKGQTDADKLDPKCCVLHRNNPPKNYRKSQDTSADAATRAASWRELTFSAGALL